MGPAWGSDEEEHSIEGDEGESRSSQGLEHSLGLPVEEARF